MFRSWLVMELVLLSALAQPFQAYASPQVRSSTQPYPSSFPLHVAIRSSKFDVVKKLVQSGTSLNGEDETGSTPLIAAVLSGNAEMVNFLLAHAADANLSSSKTLNTPLYYAVSTGRSDLTAILLRAGANADRAYEGGKTVLHLAAADARTDVLEVLLASHATVDAVDSEGETPLDVAVLNRRAGNVLLLLKNSADPGRVRALDGRGPLHEACLKGDPAIALSLIKAGANPVARDRSEQTPLDLALDYANRAVVSALWHLAAGNKALASSFVDAMQFVTVHDRTDPMRIMIESGFDVNQPTPGGSTYLHEAALHGKAKSVRLLLEHSALLEATNQEGGTPLHDAALSGNVEVISLLLNHGARIDARQTEDGATALMLASSLGHRDAVLLLLHRGANPELKDLSGHTALYRARESQDNGLIELLERAASISPVGTRTS